MARETGGSTRLGIPTLDISQDVSFNDLAQSIAGFAVYLEAQIAVATLSLARGGVTSARKKIRDSTTEWGHSRMAGSHFGVSFARYGRSAGREETGFMYDSLSSSIDVSGSGRKEMMGTFGWDSETLTKAPYIILQEQGFYSTGSFDPIRTAASGIAKFKSGREKYIEGAGSIPYARDKVIRRAPSLYSRALNMATKRFKADGFKGNPKKYADLDIPKQDKYGISKSGLFTSSPLLKTRFFNDPVKTNGKW
tara:strand:+ start:264 stop:1016 length:753 start_codon:yes stop_codon:yes gene_type:complete